jgi:hypothetical protein
MKLYLNQPRAANYTSEDILNNGSIGVFGVPVFSDIILDPKGDNVTIVRSTIEVTRQNTIVATPLQGRNGTVKEYISAQDWVITVRGSIQTQDNEIYPVSDIRKLVKLLGNADKIEVNSEYLALFDIHTIVLESDNYPQGEAQQNVQNFELRFLSDEDISLIMQDNN